MPLPPSGKQGAPSLATSQPNHEARCPNVRPDMLQYTAAGQPPPSLVSGVKKGADGQTHAFAGGSRTGVKATGMKPGRGPVRLPSFRWWECWLVGGPRGALASSSLRKAFRLARSHPTDVGPSSSYQIVTPPPPRTLFSRFSGKSAACPEEREGQSPMAFAQAASTTGYRPQRRPLPPRQQIEHPGCFQSYLARLVQGG